MQKDKVHSWEHEARRQKKQKTKKPTCQCSEAKAKRPLSDVVTTRALYTPLVYVFSRGWSVTSTTVRFHLRVLLRQLRCVLTRALRGVTPWRWVELEVAPVPNANDERLLRASGPSNSESVEIHTQQTLGMKEGGVEGGRVRGQNALGAPLILSRPVLSWWLHTSCPGTEARPSTGPETPRRSVSRCYGRLLHTICSMLLI